MLSQPATIDRSVETNEEFAAGVVRDQEILLAGSVDGHVSMWEVNFDSISRAVPFKPTLQPEKKGEVTSLAFCKGSFLAQEGQEFFVVGYFTGQIVVRGSVCCPAWYARLLDSCTDLSGVCRPTRCGAS